MHNAHQNKYLKQQSIFHSYDSIHVNLINITSLCN